MTRRERLRRCYYHEELDRPAVYSRTGYPADDPTYDALKALLQERTELKHSWDSGVLQAAYPFAWTTEPFSADFSRQVGTLRTPRGELRCSTLTSLKGLPGLHETYLLKSPEDAEAYLSMPRPAIGGEVDSFPAAQTWMGEQGIVEVSLGFNPAGFVAELFGSEGFALMSITHRELLHRLCQQQMELLSARVRFLLGSGVGPYFSLLGQEYLVPPLHGPRDFTDFNVRYDKPILDLIHEAGGRVHVHSHGSIRKVFQGFLDLGTDVLHPLEPPPMGDITAAQAKELGRGRLCLEGNLQIDRMYEADPEEVRAETEALIRAAFDDRRGLIVCPSASPYIRGQGHTCFPRYQAMVETVLAWKG